MLVGLKRLNNNNSSNNNSNSSNNNNNPNASVYSGASQNGFQSIWGCNGWMLKIKKCLAVVSLNMKASAV